MIDNFIHQFFKARLKKVLEPKRVYYLFTRFTNPVRGFQAKILEMKINSIRKSLIKNQIKSLCLYDKTTVLEMQDGKKYYWQTEDRYSLHGLIQKGEFEGSDSRYLKKIIKPSNMVFDIGANYGFYTILFAGLVGKSGQVHSFEPQKKVYKELCENVALNEVEKNTLLNNCGLSDKNSKGKIYSYNDLGVGAGSLRKRWIGKPKEEICQLMTLDSYIKSKGIEKVDFIKCDIEGAELLMLKGALAMLKKFAPAMMIEITSAASDFGHKREDVFNFLKKQGYLFYTVNNDKLIKVKEEAFADFHGNCFCFSKAKLK